ncbi:MAG TPA: aminotransferase class I/II-fold pyridoxal phosphate-dependent enzyme [Nocardioidaceae bacterium]|nr:aminotransferase class I/II-fold pyridoxal phosphate-dependent enzyme [Nocardioidaceae bacterium]
MSRLTVPLPVNDVATLRRRRSAKWRLHGPDILPLPVAEMDFSLAPAVQDALAEAVQRSDTGYAIAAPELAEAMAGFAADRWGWQIDPALTAPATDVGVGCVDLLRALCDPGDTVLVSPPVYPPFYHWVGEVDAKLAEAPLRQQSSGQSAGQWRLDLDALADAFAARPRVYLLCNPANPVGTVHTPEELAEVARLAYEHGVTVISDEIHAPLVLPGAQFTPFLTVPGAAEVGLSMVSASKAWNLAGLKCALVVAASQRMRAIIERRPPDAVGRTGHFGVLASIAALTDGVEWLDALVATLAQRREQLGVLLGGQLPQVHWSCPQATYLAWLDCREIGLGVEPQEYFLTHAKVALEPGPAFGSLGSGWVRLNFGTSEEVVSQAVRRMAAALA